MRALAFGLALLAVGCSGSSDTTTGAPAGELAGDDASTSIADGAAGDDQTIAPGDDASSSADVAAGDDSGQDAGPIQDAAPPDWTWVCLVAPASSCGATIDNAALCPYDASASIWTQTFCPFTDDAGGASFDDWRCNSSDAHTSPPCPGAQCATWWYLGTQQKTSYGVATHACAATGDCAAIGDGGWTCRPQGYSNPAGCDDASSSYCVP